MMRQKTTVVYEILGIDASRKERDALNNLYDQEMESTIAILLAMLF